MSQSDFRSSMRQSIAPAPPSAVDSLPSIDFGLDDLRERMAKFSARFDAYIDHGRRQVLEERNQYRVDMAELAEDQRMKKKDIEIIQIKTATAQQTMDKEEAEQREMESSIAALASQRDTHLANVEHLRAQIAATQAEIDARLAAQRAHAQQQEAQSRFNVPELDFWIQNLCMRVEGAGRPDRLKFVFTHIDEKLWEREAWFEMDLGGKEFNVRHCRPKVEKERVEAVVERGNETRELVVLLKGMRELFVEAMRS